MRDPVAVYVHIPFCHKKCGYCDFSSFVLSGAIVERTVDAVVRQIEASPFAGRPAKTVFFGGGTPNFLTVEQLGRILKAVLAAHPPQGSIEITTEANPGASSSFDGLREAGFNRLSLGVQSFSDDDLRSLGRIHTAEQAREAVALARRAGFDNLSLDLMFALPGQSLDGWQGNLEECLDLEPEHLSLYCLTIEPGTPFATLEKQGKLSLPGEDDQVAMYDLCDAILAKGGFERYEISNFARPGSECLHNFCYWRGEEYLAYGPGAVGCVASSDYPGGDPNCERVRFTNIKNPNQYCADVEEGNLGWSVDEELTPQSLRVERIMLGIRTREGVALADCDTEGLGGLMDRGWVAKDKGRVILTPVGRHFCNDAALALVG